MPTYLRFVKGVIDSGRPAAEREPRVAAGKPRREGHPRRQHQAGVVHAGKPGAHDQLPEARSGDAVTDVVSEEDKALVGKYSKFYGEFGAVLKEGLGEDFANKERLLALLRFASTTSDSSQRLTGGLQGPDEGRPGGHLLHHRRHPGGREEQPADWKCSSKKGIEVLLMTDRVDEWALSFVTRV
jgi:molecular chaperone HtpG